MASYTNFQSDNAKYSRNRSNYNPAVNPSVKAKGEKEQSHLMENLDRYIEFLAWARWYIDLFLDLIRPKKGGINLHTDQRTFIRASSRFYSMYGVFPRGWSKCVTKDTLLFTNDGIKEIGDYFESHTTNFEYHHRINSLDVVNRFGELERVSRVFNGGFKDTKKVSTEFNYNIEGTPNHPLLSIDNNGDIRWTNIEDLRVGDYLVISRNNNVWGNKEDIDVNNLLREWLEGLPKQSSSHIKYQDMPTKINDDIALLFGYLIGDGCLTRDDKILFSNIDTDIINNYTRIIESYFGLKTNKVKDNKSDYVIYSKYLRKYLELQGLDYNTSHYKEVPQCILSRSKSINSNFLKGLFDTDGTVESNRVSFTTASEKLSKQVQFMLLNFGIISSRRLNVNKNEQSHWTVSITGANINMFAEEVGFTSQRKSQKLTSILNIERNTNKDIIPFQNERVSRFYQDVKSSNPNLYDKLYHVMKGNNNLSYDKLDYMLNLNDANCSAEYLYLKELKEMNYFFAKIENIEDSQNYVFDFSLPKTHSFVSNGIISHNTFLEVLTMYAMCVLYPGMEFALTAQTKENAGELLKDKHSDIIKKYPWFKNEIIDTRFSKSDAEVIFLNNSRIDILANSQTSKGQRRHAIMIEESALLDDFTFQDALFPIVEHGRLTVGEKGMRNPEELDQKVNFYTTAGYRGSSEFERNLRMKENMINLNGEIILGSDWHLGCWYGRGSTKKQIMKKKDEMSPIAFAQNYESKWVGSASNALVDIKKILQLRTLTTPETKGDGISEYYLSMDVARSEKTSNNQSSIAVLKVLRDKTTTRVSKMQLVNIIYVPNTFSFTAQAIVLKRVKYIYNAKMVSVDINGLGKGIWEELFKEHTDPMTSQKYPCWDSINTDDKPENPSDSDRCLFGMTSQGLQTDIIVSFMDVVEGEKLELLTKHPEAYHLQDKEYIENVVSPMQQTDFLVDEIANIQLEHLNNGRLALKQTTKRVDKDRLMALMYGVYYILRYENNPIKETENIDLSQLTAVFKKPNIYS